MLTRMKLTSTFSENEISKDVPYEFTVHIEPNDDLGKEIIPYIYFSKKPEKLEIKLGENWIPVESNFQPEIAVEEDFIFRVTFNYVAKVKMCFYCTFEGKYLADVIQYANIKDITVPSFDTTFPEIVHVNEEIEFEVNIHPNEYIGKTCKIQYIFNSMDSIKRIEQYIDNSDSEYNGKYIVVDKSEFFSGELRTLAEDTVKFKVIFFAYGEFKLYILVDGIIQYVKKFTVKSSSNNDTPLNEKIEVVCVDKPDNSTVEIQDNRITFIYPEIIKKDYWKFQYKKHSGGSPNDIYCGLRFTYPYNVTHYKVISKTLSGVYESTLNEIIPADYNSLIWYFPVARKINGEFKELDYYKTGTFCDLTVKFYAKKMEVYSNTYNIKCKFRVTKTTNITQYSSELLYYVKMLLNGCSVHSAIKTYGIKCNWDYRTINKNIIKYGNNFGLFALDQKMIHNSNEAEAVNYVIHKHNGDILHRMGISHYNPENEFVKKLVFETLGKNIKNSKHYVCYENFIKF